jgi:hypothetical protein
MARRQKRRRSGGLGRTPFNHFEQAAYEFKRRIKHPSCHNAAKALIEAQSMYVHALESNHRGLIGLTQRHRKKVERLVQTCTRG